MPQVANTAEMTISAEGCKPLTLEPQTLYPYEYDPEADIPDWVRELLAKLYPRATPSAPFARRMLKVDGRLISGDIGDLDELNWFKVTITGAGFDAAQKWWLNHWRYSRTSPKQLTLTFMASGLDE